MVATLQLANDGACCRTALVLAAAPRPRGPRRHPRWCIYFQNPLWAAAVRLIALRAAGRAERLGVVWRCRPRCPGCTEAQARSNCSSLALSKGQSPGRDAACCACSRHCPLPPRCIFRIFTNSSCHQEIHQDRPGHNAGARGGAGRPGHPGSAAGRVFQATWPACGHPGCGSTARGSRHPPAYPAHFPATVHTLLSPSSWNHVRRRSAWGCRRAA